MGGKTAEGPDLKQEPRKDTQDAPSVMFVKNSVCKSL